jgi:predicted PolB exonuclease-like 3'-5' exonuclease
MRFSTFSVSVLPDIETARHNHNLDGLSDKDVGNVLFHQRKQRTGDSEILPWHQLRIAAITCIDYNQGEVTLTTQSLETSNEKALLELLQQRLNLDTHLMNWGADSFTWPLITYRAMKHGLVWPDAFDLTPEDLQLSFAMAGDADQSLDDLAKQFLLPGLRGQTRDSLWDAFVNDHWAEITRFSIDHAVNSYLLALRLHHFNGTLSTDEKHSAVRSLADHIDEVTLHSLFRAFGMKD